MGILFGRIFFSITPFNELQLKFMNYFKKLFGLQKNENQTTETIEVDMLDKYRNIPWMTNERLENISTCLSAGFKPSSSLPTELGRQPRPKIEIAKRLNAITSIILWLLSTEEDISSEEIINFVATNELDLFLTTDEKQIFSASREDEELQNMIGWKFENAWPLAWYLGYTFPDITGEMMTGEQMQQIIYNYTCPLNEKIEDWIKTIDTVTTEDLMKTEDLFYCLHNAVRSSQMGSQTVPLTFDPVANGGVIHERRHSLTWMLSEGIKWEETDLST